MHGGGGPSEGRKSGRFRKNKKRGTGVGKRSTSRGNGCHLDKDARCDKGIINIKGVEKIREQGDETWDNSKLGNDENYSCDVKLDTALSADSVHEVNVKRTEDDNQRLESDRLCDDGDDNMTGK